MAKHGKKYREALEKVDRGQQYSPVDALTLTKETAYTKFDSTVELHIRLGVDPRHADQQVRDVVVLPHGLGKTVRVLVFAQGDGAAIAREAGADYVADDDELIKQEISGELFDEELFGIFVQQTTENLNAIRSALAQFADSEDKKGLFETLSTYLKKLRSSTNYMGYENLTRLYENWISQLNAIEQDLAADVPRRVLSRQADPLLGSVGHRHRPARHQGQGPRRARL